MDEKKNQEELLKAVYDVLEEAFAEVDRLNKSDTQASTSTEPTSEVKKADMPVEFLSGSKPEEKKEEKEEEKKDGKELEKEAPAMEAAPKEEPSEEEKEEEESEDDEDEEDEDKKLDEKFEKFAKSLTEELTKSLTEKFASDLKKSEDEKASQTSEIESLKKSVESLQDTIKKLAETPQPRKGLSGVSPLYKSEEKEVKGAQTLNKSELLNALLSKKAGGDKRVDTNLIYKAERGSLSQADFEKINGILA